MTIVYILDKRKDTNDEIEKELDIIHSEIKIEDDDYLELFFYSIDGFVVNVSFDKDDPFATKLRTLLDESKKPEGKA